MKISTILQIASVQILMTLLEKGETRHAEISKMLTSRGTLSISLRDLDSEGLIKRRVAADTKPAQSFYSLTEKGEKIAKKLKETQDSL